MSRGGIELSRITGTSSAFYIRRMHPCPQPSNEFLAGGTRTRRGAMGAGWAFRRTFPNEGGLRGKNTRDLIPSLSKLLLESGQWHGRSLKFEKFRSTRLEPMITYPAGVQDN